jgi:hypothetical protein
MPEVAPTREQVLQWVREAFPDDARKQLLGLLRRCRVYVQRDVEMMDALTRHSPLDPQSQATHDTTEYESERLLPLIDAALAGAASRPVTNAGWIAGFPPKPYSEEWFVAETTYGDRVVLRALPEEYAYDFRTADHTYWKADKIVRWMQFPDSEYKRFTDFAAGAASRPVTGEDVLTEEECELLLLRRDSSFTETLQAAARIGAERERERAARVCDGLVHALDHAGNEYRREATASQCAAAIRRGEGA